jgi:hypothetical protein
MATQFPDYFETTIAADITTAPSEGTVQVITVASGAAVPTVTGGNRVPAWLGNNNVQSSLEAVYIIYHAAGSTAVTVERNADGRHAVTHSDGDGFYGPAVWGEHFEGLAGGGGASTDPDSTTVTEQAANLVSATTRIRTPAERLYLFDRFG